MIEDIKSRIAQLAMDIEGFLNDASECAEALKEEFDILLTTSWMNAEHGVPNETEFYLIRTVDINGKDEISLCWWRCHSYFNEGGWDRIDIRKGLVKVVEFCEIPK